MRHNALRVILIVKVFFGIDGLHETCQLIFESIDIGAQRHHPIGIKRFLNVLHLIAAHMS